MSDYARHRYNLAKLCYARAYTALEPDMEQYDLYRGTPPHVATATSLDAARKIAPCATTLRARVLKAITDSPVGATDHELEHQLGMIHQTCSARRRELVLKGEIIDSGSRRVTRGGRTAIVWVAKS